MSPFIGSGNTTISDVPAEISDIATGIQNFDDMFKKIKAPVRYVLYLSILSWGLITCKSSMDLAPSGSRRINTREVKGYHSQVNLRIAWFPYEDRRVIRTGDGNWTIVADKEKGGALPVILVTYPDSQDSVWIEMDMETEMLGKLLKHTLMTEVPIEKPFLEYLERTPCTKCHPPEVKVNFE